MGDIAKPAIGRLSDEESALDRSILPGERHYPEGRCLTAALWASAGLLVICFTVITHQYQTQHIYVNHVSGIWSVLATDLAYDGVLYRPMASEDGYGGTRYAPLNIVLQAALIKLGMEPLAAGLTLAVLALILLVISLFMLLRKFGMRASLAAGCALTLLAGYNVLIAVSDIRGDATAIALSVLGVNMCVGGNNRVRRLAPAAIFFALAFAAKISAVSFCAAAILTLWMANQRRDAIRLAAFTAIAVGCVIGLTEIASGGRAIHNFIVFADGGTSFKAKLRAPQYLIRNGFSRDAQALVMVILGIGAAAALPRAGWKSLPVLMMAFSAAATLYIFTSAGVWFNHLMEIQVAALIVIGFAITRSEAVGRLLIASLAALALVGSGVYVDRWQAMKHVDHRSELLETVEFLKDVPAPLLAESPLVPLARNERPWLAEPFSVRVMGEYDPTLLKPLWKAMDDRRFGALVLLSQPPEPRWDNWLTYTHFGKDFIGYVDRNYVFVKKIGHYYIYLPRPAS